MFHSIYRILLLITIAIASIFIWENFRQFDFFKTTSKMEHKLVLKEISTLGKLELARFSFRDVIEHELVQQFLPNPKALLIVQGEVIGCIDLSKVQENDIINKGDTLLITLPKPEICTYKIDHQKTKIYDIQFAVFQEQALIGEAYKQAELQLKYAALDTGILEQTQKNATIILKPILEKMTNKSVIFIFKI